MADPLLSPATRGFREGRVTRLETAIGSWNAYHARSPATAVAFGRTPAEIVVGGRDLVVVRTADGEPLRVFTPTAPPVRWLDVHADGGLLLSAHGDGRARLWDVDTAEPAGDFVVGATAEIRFLDGARFVARAQLDASGGGRVAVHDVASGRERRALGERAGAMAVLADGSVALAEPGRLRRVDASNGREIWSCEWFGAGGRLALSPSGALLVAWPSSMQARTNRPVVVEVADGRILAELSNDRVRAPSFVAWVGEAAIFTIAGSTMERRGTTDVVALRWSVSLRDEIAAAALTPDRNFAALALGRGGLLWANVVQGSAAARGAAPERGLEVAIAPAGDRLAIGGPRIAIHRADGQREPATLDLRAGEGRAVPERFGEDGWIDVRLVVPGARTPPPLHWRWHPQSGRQTPRIPSTMRARSADGAWIASSAGAAVLLGRTGAEDSLRLEGHLPTFEDRGDAGERGGARARTVPVEVGDLAFTPDSRWLASAAGDATIRLWDVASGSVRDVFRTGDELGHPARIAFTRDGVLLIAASHAGELMAWSMESGESAWRVRAHAPAETGPGLALDPAGRWAATFSADGTVSLRLPSTGEEVERVDLGSADDAPRAVAFDGDGRLLAVATERGVVLLFALRRPGQEPAQTRPE